MEIKNFAIIEGSSATIKDGRLTYEGTQNKSSKVPNTLNIEEAVIENTIIRSDAVFGNGTLEFTAKFKSYNTGIILKLISFDNKKVRCGYSRMTGKFIISKFINSKWDMLSSAGDLKNYNLNDEIHFKIDVKGSLIKLYINKVLLCEANLSIKDSPIEFILETDSDLEFYNVRKKAEQAKIFVIMQFSKDYDDLYEDVIKPVSEKFGFECVRADEYYTSTPILSDIIRSIEEATAIIAEITPDNPNVFYEIGYSHAIKKPTILLCDKRREKLPFDLSSFRTLFYENTIAGKKKIEISLTSYLENIT